MQRRTFIKTSAAGAAAYAFTPFAATAQSYRRILGANDRIRAAIFGCYRRFPGLLEGLASAENVELAYVCDVDARRQEAAVQRAAELLGRAPQAEKDLRRILEQPAVDVVFHATPDHWHAPGTILSLQAGKHVYVEKPCSHNLAEDDLLTDWQKKSGLVVQMGAQQRSDLATQEIIREIHGGIIGEAYMATAFYANSRQRVPDAQAVPVPDYLDWELFQGPAPRRPFLDILGDYHWHWFWHWGTAETGNNATHELDVARWALQLTYPQEIRVNSGKYHFRDDPWEMYDTMYATFRFPGQKVINWDGKSRVGFQDYGAGRGTIIYGTEGSVFVDRAGYRLYSRAGELLRERASDGDEGGTALGGGGGMTSRHVHNFLDAVRGKAAPACPIAEGAISTHLCHYANIASRENDAALAIDPQTGHFKDDGIMARYWGREYAPGWAPEVP
jgi:predicted dehydrogenase